MKRPELIMSQDWPDPETRTGELTNLWREPVITVFWPVTHLRGSDRKARESIQEDSKKPLKFLVSGTPPQLPKEGDLDASFEDELLLLSHAHSSVSETESACQW